MWRWGSGQRIVIGASFAAFTMCCVLPIAYLLATTLGLDSATYAALVLDSRQRGLLFNTAMLGTGTALFATAIGAPLGVVLARVPLRGKAVMRLVAAAPVLLPPYIVALAWTYVGLRVAHSLVQATRNVIPVRFAIFSLGSLVLLVLLLRTVRAIA